MNDVTSPRNVSGAITVHPFDNACAFSIIDGFKPKNSCINIIEFAVVYCFDLSDGVAL